MKRINPKTNLPFKYGDVREDGHLFINYATNRIKKDGFFVESWVTPKSFKKHGTACTNRSTVWAKENPKLHRQNAIRWQRNNLDKCAAARAKRKAAELQRTPKWLSTEHLRQIEDFYTIAKMFQMYTGFEYHVDHIEPLLGKDRSGLHVPWNLQVLPAIENIKKSNKTS